MITTTDIANIIYTDCLVFGIALYQEGNIKPGRLTEERIVVHPKEQADGSVWRKSFVEVNFLVPDIAKDTADLARLGELERLACKTLKGTGRSDGTTYTYAVYSTSTGRMPEMQCHFVNVKLLFRTINTIE